MDQDTFFDRYKFDIEKDRIGGGSFGTVYKAWDNLRDEWKAIKVSEVKIIDGKEFSLVSEVKASQKTGLHKNIAIYEDVQQLKMRMGVFDYAIMQYYEEGNLKQLLDKQLLNDAQKKFIIQGLVSGISFLHVHRVIHRDLKPSNILIAKDIEGNYIPKIADFGLSKAIEDDELSRLTNSFGGGTLDYSSPEQLMGQKLYYNTDLWSLGVIIYQILVGSKPFIAESSTGSAEAKRALVYQNIVKAKIPDISHLDPLYVKIIAGCLVKEPELRIKNASEILKWIEEETRSTQIVEATDQELDDVTLIYKKPVEDEVTLIQPIQVQEEVKKTSVKRKKKKSVLLINTKRIVGNIKTRIYTLIGNVGIAFLSFFKLIGSGIQRLLVSGIDLFSKYWKLMAAAIIGVTLFFGGKFSYNLAIQNYFTGPIPFSDDNKYGYLDKEGEIVQLARFTYASKFKWGKAIAETEDSIYYLNQSGIIYQALEKVKPQEPPLAIQEETNKNSLDYIEQPELPDRLVIDERIEERKLADQEKIDLNQAKKDGTLAGYDLFRRNYPNSEFLIEVMGLEAEIIDKAQFQQEEELWETTLNSGLVAYYQKFIEQYPSSSFAQEAKDSILSIQLAIEESTFQDAKSLNTLKSYNQYLLKYPNGRFVDNASQEMESIKLEEENRYWGQLDGIGTRASYNEYVNSYPDGQYTKEANEKLKDLETSTWKQTKTINNVDAYEEFLKMYPDSEHKNEAIKIRDLLRNSLGEKEKEKSAIPQLIQELEKDFVRIPSGEYFVGCDEEEKDCGNDSKPGFKVKVDEFLLSKYEVTQRLYSSITGENPSKYQDCSNCPVESVSWYEVTLFIQKINQLPGNPYRYRLPTEVEWEYSASAGSKSEYAGSDNIELVANYNNPKGTNSVGSHRPNKLGIFDLSGNVAEWCSDWYDKKAYSLLSKGKKPEGQGKVVRGGSYIQKSRYCKIKYRNEEDPKVASSTIGFRLVRS